MKTPDVGPSDDAPLDEGQQSDLAEIGPGLTVEIIEKALRRAQAAADYTTRNDASTAEGLTKWLTQVRSLREDLSKVGWGRADGWNIPQIWSPDGSTAIVVRGGNAFTGTFDGEARTSRPIGKRLRALLQPEAHQGDLFEVPVLDIRRPDVYLLLSYHFVDARRGIDEIRFELSLVDEVSKKGQVTRWRDRIVFRAIDLTHEPQPGRHDDDQSDGFEVRRKNA